MKKSIVCVVASIMGITGAELRADTPIMDFVKSKRLQNSKENTTKANEYSRLPRQEKT